jgi:hypothetical protein
MVSKNFEATSFLKKILNQPQTLKPQIMNFKFIYLNTPNAMILSSMLFLKNLKNPEIFRCLFTANFIILFLELFKTEIIRLANPLKKAIIYLLRPFIPTTVFSKITITAVL